MTPTDEPVVNEIIDEVTTTADAAEEELAAALPLIVLDDSVVLPHMSVTLPAVDGPVVAALEAAGTGRLVLLVPRGLEADEDAPLPDSLYHMGVVARVEQVGWSASLGGRGAVLRALVRAEIGRLVQEQPYPAATYIERPDPVSDDPELEQLTEETRTTIVALLDARGEIGRASCRERV